MTQPLNFCRQVKKAFLERIDRPSTGPVTRESMHHIITATTNGVKIILPYGGVLLNDAELRGLARDVPLHLPHPHIVLEFEGMPSGKPTKGVVQGGVCVGCYESDDEVVMVGAMKNPADGAWVPLPRLKIKGGLVDIEGKGQLFIEQETISILDEDTQAKADAFTETFAWILCATLNALACSNVAITRLPRDKKRKTIKSALPFDEYHVLTIDTPGKLKLVTGSAPHTGRHPREHLRRGHIRVYENGLKIWVNACVVAAGALGKITKDYALRRAS